MTATIIDGVRIARDLRSALAGETAALAERCGRRPSLLTVLVGDDPASAVYVGMKIRACEEVGITSVHRPLPADTTQSQLLEVIHAAASDDSIDGILVQLPLPAGMDEHAVINAIPPGKDVDCFHPCNVGLLASGIDAPLQPCTPAGVMRLLEESGVEVAGKHAVVVGRSSLVGRPAATMLLNRHATVTIVHSRTPDLAAMTRQADILVVAVGRPGLVTGDMIRPGAVVIDVGVNRTPAGLVGDVDFASAQKVAGMITPVPGGVGPMTVATLMANTIAAAAARIDPSAQRW